MRLTLRPTVDTDVWFVSEHMRLADQIECGLGNPGASPFTTLQSSVAISHNATTLVDPEGEPIALFGCPFDEDFSRGYPWMLSTSAVQHYARDLLVLGNQVVYGWHREAQHVACPLLCNWIYKRHASAQRYVARLGFTIMPAPNGDFDFFYSRIDHV